MIIQEGSHICMFVVSPRICSSESYRECGVKASFQTYRAALPRGYHPKTLQITIKWMKGSVHKVALALDLILLGGLLYAKPADGASGVRKEPHIDTFDMEAVAANRQQLHVLAIDELAQANRALPRRHCLLTGS
ncbi:hypothetical protein GOP47_0009031 [Adiantum capillus-veneris]|uniref:Uncharacterized protein n=1 Tax=Adiantum capillus-veneris TaxID=13818 RepID=A0A9D4UZF0_ADICA|nr:hypothetical protein GOP47_0009031 [Adiantum capillus-veneris]